MGLKILQDKISNKVKRLKAAHKALREADKMINIGWKWSEPSCRRWILKAHGHQTRDPELGRLDSPTVKRPLYKPKVTGCAHSPFGLPPPSVVFCSQQALKGSAVGIWHRLLDVNLDVCFSLPHPLWRLGRLKIVTFQNRRPEQVPGTSRLDGNEEAKSGEKNERRAQSSGLVTWLISAALLLWTRPRARLCDLGTPRMSPGPLMWNTQPRELCTQCAWLRSLKLKTYSFPVG